MMSNVRDLRTWTRTAASTSSVVVLTKKRSAAGQTDDGLEPGEQC